MRRTDPFGPHIRRTKTTAAPPQKGGGKDLRREGKRHVQARIAPQHTSAFPIVRPDWGGHNARVAVPAAERWQHGEAGQTSHSNKSNALRYVTHQTRCRCKTTLSQCQEIGLYVSIF